MKFLSRSLPIFTTLLLMGLVTPLLLVTDGLRPAIAKTIESQKADGDRAWCSHF